MAFTGKLVFGTGRAQVEFSREQAAAFQDVLKNLLPTASEAIENETRRIDVGFRRRAPVKSGKFKRSIERGGRFTTSEFIAFVRNTDPKAWHVRWGSNAPLGFKLGGRVINDLIFKPAKDGVDKIADAMADDAAKIAGGG